MIGIEVGVMIETDHVIGKVMGQFEDLLTNVVQER